MEKPEQDIVEVVHMVVQNMSGYMQARAVERYYCPSSVEFKHFLINLGTADDLLAVYQFWSSVNLRQGATIRSVWYNEETDAMVVHLTQHCRPFFHFYSDVHFEMLIFLRLEEFSPAATTAGVEVGEVGEGTAEGGAAETSSKLRRKRIVEQRDFFLTNPLLKALPGIDVVYRSTLWRETVALFIVVVTRMRREGFDVSETKLFP
ncbi:hypothetical protein CBR_g20187 [Chara braunii]|uniref:SigF-like NTF2-like domain-containing protein n=1 Tax=Chara braunii TaxID=69332 RepID=A0A388KZS6_CHABU|nr:hypothetical protein CBR_g20187 [Chara braunii]|eukprot:GBG75556.1 hypothetical protein CBR_g20187 [Chara braunii]